MRLLRQRRHQPRHRPPSVTRAILRIACIAATTAAGSLFHAPKAAAQVRPLPIPAPAPLPPRSVVYDDPDTTRRSGPRFGVVWLGGSLPDSVETRYDRRHVSPLVTLFGWQFEFQVGRNPGGPQPLTALIPAVGGLEQGLVIPTLSWIIGLRLPNNFEFGVGPNISPAGPALVVTSGLTMRMGTINVPVNVALVPSQLGPRLSLTTGFNTNR